MRSSQKKLHPYIASLLYTDPDKPAVVKPIVSTKANPLHRAGGYRQHDFNFNERLYRAMPKPFIPVASIKPSHKERKFQRLVMWFAMVRSIVKRAVARFVKAVVPVLSTTDWNAFPPLTGKHSPVGNRALSSMGVRLA